MVRLYTVDAIYFTVRTVSFLTKCQKLSTTESCHLTPGQIFRLYLFLALIFLDLNLNFGGKGFVKELVFTQQRGF